jgi:low temperature requirement protein LtrA
LPRPPEGAERTDGVSTLELFFDLVFVFTITQLTAVLSGDPTLRGLLRVVLMLGVIFWMYGGYAWLTNAVAPDRAARRLVLLGGMAGFLVLALTIPEAFAGGDLAFGLAYLAVVSIHAGLYSRTSVTHTVRALVRLAPFNLASALLVLAAVVAVGIGASGQPVDPALVIVAVLGLLVAACLWWAYFGGDDDRAERALAAVPDERRAAVAVRAFGYWHLPILLGIIVLAAGLKHAIGHAFEPLDTAHALLLAGGVAVFLAGDVGFRRTLRIGPGRLRAIAAALALATVPLGLGASAVLQLCFLGIVLVGSLAAESSGTWSRGRQG